MLNLERKALTVCFPSRIDDNAIQGAWDALFLQGVQQLVKAHCPASNKVDVLQAAYAKHLLKLFEAKWNDEARIGKFFGEILCDCDLLLDAHLCECRIAAA